MYSPGMRIFVPKEIAERETRVALVPESVTRLVKAGHEVVVEAGAGERAALTDAAYQEAGAALVPDAKAAYAQADMTVKVREPLPLAGGGHEADLVRAGSVLIGFLNPARNADLLHRLAARGIYAFAMESVPRTSRAQKMDALSSMSTVAGYKATLIGALALGKFFPLLMTAAGTIPPARVFVLGAGVAGLTVIATARRLGAVVEAFDVRPAVKEEVQSLGATFIGLPLAAEEAVAAGGYAKELTKERHEQELALIAGRLPNVDVLITSAMIPGRPAPRLITEAMVRTMKPGSVIVDMAAESGGNCELTEPDQVKTVHGVTIHGPVGLSGALPLHASQMYSRNVLALVQHLSTKDAKLNLDFSDDITRDACVTREAVAPAAAGKPS
jgi:NAD(P) transhydrogenase subunit alpha